MKKSTKIFWIIFAVYSVMALIGSLIVEHYQNNLGFLIEMKGYIFLMKYYFIFGLLLFLIVFFSMLKDRAHHKKQINKLEDEKRELKATLYDLRNQQEPATPPSDRAGEEPPQVESQD